MEAEQTHLDERASWSHGTGAAASCLTAASKRPINKQDGGRSKNKRCRVGDRAECVVE
jgi:hypothetical protein